MAGALFHYISTAESKTFQPMPPNFGILPPLEQNVRQKALRYAAYRDRALKDLSTWATAMSLPLQPLRLDGCDPAVVETGA